MYRVGLKKRGGSDMVRRWRKWRRWSYDTKKAWISSIWIHIVTKIPMRYSTERSPSLSPAILLFTAPWRHTLIKMDVRRVLHNFISLLPTSFVHFFHSVVCTFTPNTSRSLIFTATYFAAFPCSHLVFYSASIFGPRMKSNRTKLRLCILSVSPSVR